MLGITREQLAEASTVAHATLTDFESGKRRPYARTISAIRQALEAAGVEFIEENGGGPGVRLRKGLERTQPPNERRSVGAAASKLAEVSNKAADGE